MNNVNEITKTQTTAVAFPSVEERLGQTTMGLVLGSGSLVSLWSVATLVGALATNGVAGVARGLVTALTGL
jgi:hypothetical protein